MPLKIEAGIKKKTFKRPSKACVTFSELYKTHGANESHLTCRRLEVTHEKEHDENYI